MSHLRDSFFSFWGERWSSFILGSSLLVAFTAAAAGQEQTPQTATSTLKVLTKVVNVYAIVKDKKGRLIPNLNKEDFEVSEDKALQEIRYFSRETDTPLTIGIMVDTSPSQRRVLQVEKDEAKAFIRQILRPKDLAFVLHFDIEVELLQNFTRDAHLLSNAIDQTEINGGGQGPTPGTFPTGSSGGATHLYDAVYLAANDLLKHEVGRKVLILLTDGEDQGSRFKIADGLEAAQKSDVIIYSVNIVDRAFYGSLGMGFGGDAALKKLSEETGGHVIGVKRARDTAAAFEEIASELRTQYLLGYTPSNSKNDGTYRKIQVGTHTSDYKVQARRGYYAPTE